MKPRKVTTFGQLIERILEVSGLTAYRLGQRSGITAAQISQYRNAKRKPTAESLWRLLAGAGLPWAWVDENLAAPELPKE